jgi:hypothetical protein
MEHASVFTMERDGHGTIAASDPVARAIDEAQQAAGQGPHLDVIEGVEPYCEATDLGGDGRWPQFTPSALRTGVHGVLAVRLFTTRTRASLGLYAQRAGAFTLIDRAMATHAGMALERAEVRAEDHERSERDLHDALATRAVIGQAQGILMERQRITADAAFDVLRRASQHLNVKLRDVAQRMVDTGEGPTSGS